MSSTFHNTDVKAMQSAVLAKTKKVLYQDTNNNNNPTALNTHQNSCECSHTMPHIDDSDSEWQIESSEFAKNTLNPVRRLIEQMKLEPNPNKPMIALSIGDPTVLSDMEKPNIIREIIAQKVLEKHNDAYTPSFGTEAAREAIAKYSSRPPRLNYKCRDIVLSHGCSQALELAMVVLANRGQNILIPQPGFSIYKTLCTTLGIEVKYYNLLSERDWEIDLEQMKSLIDEKTVAILVNNPSNPCGSVFTMEHCKDIIKIAEQFHLPIIADEVYGDMVFAGKEFYYFSELSERVPVLSCNALSKRFILPGWRFGWIAIHDPKNHFEKNVRQGLMDLTTRILGPNSLIQAAVPEILANTPSSYFDNIMSIVQENAETAFEALVKLPGLKPKKPSGAMYMMVGLDIECFPGIKDDQAFAELLVQEQSVFCIPAVTFMCPNYIRIVLTMKHEKVVEACERIGLFVRDHYKSSN